jgi:cytochrome c-L
MQTRTNRPRGRRRTTLATLGSLAALGGWLSSAPATEISFRHIVDDSPLDVSLRPNEPATEAVRRFHATGVDPYTGDAAALAEGKRLYETWCQSCHLPDGTGRIGPSLVSDVHAYPRTKTDVGMFEIVIAGGTGAMQPFRDRLSQDEILKVIAYVRSLKR